MELERTISTGLGDNTITLRDRVTNRAAQADYLQFLYHCNLGYPFASPELIFETEPHEVTPRDTAAASAEDGRRALELQGALYDAMRKQCWIEV